MLENNVLSSIAKDINNDPDTETKCNYIMIQSIGVSFGREDNSAIANIYEAMPQLPKQRYGPDILDIKNPTEFLERFSRLCLFGIKVVPEIRLSISHTYKNGEGVLEFEIKFPKKFLNEDEAGVNQVIQIKDQIEKIEDVNENHFSNENEQSLFTSLTNLNGSGVLPIRNPTEFLEKVSKLCLFGLKLIPGLLFNLAHAPNNGEEFVQFEMKVPKKFLNEDKDTIHTSTDMKDQNERRKETATEKNSPTEQSLFTSMKYLWAKSSSYATKKEHSQAMQVNTNFNNDGNLTTVEVGGCNVCGDKASKYCHYGGRSCQSCRAFFRRSVLKSSR